MIKQPAKGRNRKELWPFRWASPQDWILAVMPEPHPRCGVRLRGTASRLSLPSSLHTFFSCHQRSLFSLLVSQQWSKSEPAELSPTSWKGRGCEHHRRDKSPASCLCQRCQAGPVYILVCGQGLVRQNYFSCLGLSPDQTHYAVKSLINLASSQLH